MAAELNIYEKIQLHLFENTETALKHLTPTEIEVKKRVMLSVSMLMDNPMLPDQELVKFLMYGCAGQCECIGQSQAYRDVAAIRTIVGNIKLSSKAWYRYMIVEAAKKGYEIAEQKEDAKGMAACLDKIGKYTRADKEDDPFDYSQMLPPSFEPTDDVTVLEGFEKIDNLEEERKRFRSLFTKNLKERAEDITETGQTVS